jgi:hypothetical protein
VDANHVATRRARSDLVVADRCAEGQLLEDDYVWVKEIGVLWHAVDGSLRRARFTHGAYFSTEQGQSHVDSGGNTRRL